MLVVAQRPPSPHQRDAWCVYTLPLVWLSARHSRLWILIMFELLFVYKMISIPETLLCTQLWERSSFVGFFFFFRIWFLWWMTTLASSLCSRSVTWQLLLQGVLPLFHNQYFILAFNSSYCYLVVTKKELSPPATKTRAEACRPRTVRESFITSTDCGIKK